jgi:glycosyltransferase involved in cell wall biosynthesis
LATHHVPYIPASLSRRLKGNLINQYSIYFLSKIADRVITVAERYRRELIHSGVNPNKIITVHNGIDDSIGSGRGSVKLLRNEGFNSDFILIGTTSRLHPQKGLQFLIEALPAILKKNDKVHLVLFGSGPLKAQLESLSVSLGVSDHVHFLGFKENISDWITGLDIFLLPSLAEGHSISLLEAMRAALPIICTPVGDNQETIRSYQDGIIVPPKNSKVLADAVIELINNLELRQSIGESARKRFEREFTETRMLDATLNVIQQCIS